MEKNIKTVFRGFDYLHCDDLAGFLEEMAAKGWHFKEWGAGLKFEKGEPEQATYAVEVFTGASEQDLKPEPNTKEFAEYCEAAGWKLIDAKQKFCIFKQIDENAVKILTDEERLANVAKTNWVMSLILVILYGVNAWIRFDSIFDRIMPESIFSKDAWFQLIVWSCLFAFETTKLLYRFYWGYKKNKQIQRGEKIYLGTGKKRFLWDRVLSFAIFLLMVVILFLWGQFEILILFVTTYVIFFVVAYFIAKFRPDSMINMLIQALLGVFTVVLCIIVTFTTIEQRETEYSVEDFPLKITDYREADQETNYIRRYIDENWLGEKETYLILGEEDLTYDVYRSDIDWILERIWEKRTDILRNENVTDCTREWNAMKAFRNEAGEYYVQYEDAIFIMDDSSDVELTREQIQIIREKMNLGR